MANNAEKRIDRRALLRGIGTFAGAASARRALMAASELFICRRNDLPTVP